MIYVFLFLVSITTAAISGVVGMAGGVTLLACMTLVLPMSAVIPIHGIVQLLSNSLRTFYLRKNLNIEIFKFFLIGAPLGAFTSYYFIQSLPSDKIPLTMIVAFIFYMVFKPKNLPSILLKPWQYGIVGFVSGFLGLLIGATGPFLAPFFLRDDYTKEEIISTQASCQMVTHILKIPVFLTLGFPYFEYVNTIGLMLIGTIIGTSLGVGILKKLKPSLFIYFYKTVLVFVAFRLLYKILF